jgi:Tol biopolymer transport system component
LYVTPNGVLTAAPFDLDRLETTGPARSVAEGILVEAGGGAEYDISDDGVLVYFGGGSDASQLVVVDRTGSERALLDEARNYVGVSYSPSGNLVAAAIAADAATDIWTFDLTLGTLDKRTFGSENTYPTWSRNGRDIIFSSDRSGVGRGLWSVPADGSGQPTPLYGVESLTNVYEGQWSPDEQWFVFRATGDGTGRDILGFTIGADTVVVPIAGSVANERTPALSPDGGWLAYASDKTGQDEIYVQEFPGPGGISLVSSDGGTEPIWAPNGRELYYRTSANFIAVRVETRPTFRVLERRTLFSDIYLRQINHRRYDVHPNGESFVMVKATGLAELIVTLNWMDRLRN